MQERVVITGLGAVSPVGLSAEESWRNVLAGVSGVGPITAFDASDFPVQIACEVKGFQPENFMPGREVRRRDRVEQFAAAAGKEAIQHSGLQITGSNAGRIGVVVASAIGGLSSLQEAVFTLRDEGPRRISPFLIPMLMSNGPAGLLAIDYGCQGPCFSINSACASGSDSLGMAWMMLRAGMLEAVIAGGCEATINQIGLGAFDRLGALSRRKTDDHLTPRPFDRQRDGLVMGEGAAILVLERESFARQRGATILAELAGYAATADACHVTAPSENGLGGAQAIRLACQTAGIAPHQVDYINAHGTATQLNDLAETRAIKLALGEAAYRIPISSTKSMTGHMMGATAALEALFCVCAIRDGAIPPTLHYQTPDPQCDLDYVPNQARQAPIQVALSNAFGFGGHNSILVIRAYSG